MNFKDKARKLIDKFRKNNKKILSMEAVRQLKEISNRWKTK